jgi:hypothetical protein
MMARINAAESGFPCGSHDRSRLARRRGTGIATMLLDYTIAEMVIDSTAYRRMELHVPEKVRHFEAPELAAHKVLKLGEVQLDATRSQLAD